MGDLDDELREGGDLAALRAELLADSETRAAYDRLAPKYARASELIRGRPLLRERGEPLAGHDRQP